MFTKFWDELAEALAGRWAAQALGLAIAFWGGGLLAWAWRYGWRPLLDWLENQGTVTYIALTVSGLVLLAASSAVATWLQLTVLRLVEGYWPWPLENLRFVLAKRLQGRLKKKETRWQELANKSEKRTSQEQVEYVRLDVELAHYPLDARYLMPTRLGNILRAAEEYPWRRYGLTMSVCWPRLWLLLSKETQDALVGARERLNSAVHLFMWSALFVIWTVWGWWVAPIAGVGAVAAYWRMLSAAGTYGDLMRAAFDLNRFALYEALRWPLPSDPIGENSHGQRLSEYLFRGTGSRDIEFTVPTKE